MASRRDEQQAAIRLKVMRLISQDPEISTWQVADEVGISNGSAYYVLTALVGKGFVKLGNFKNNLGKARHTYLLTPKGIHEKFCSIHRVVGRIRKEYENLCATIDALEEEVGIADKGVLSLTFRT